MYPNIVRGRTEDPTDPGPVYIPTSFRPVIRTPGTVPGPGTEVQIAGKRKSKEKIGLFPSPDPSIFTEGLSFGGESVSCRTSRLHNSVKGFR